MTPDDRKWQYLFERHSIDEVRSWNRRLQYFRYFRAYGGHANDEDSLDVAIRYHDSDDLLSVLSQLEIYPTIHSEAPPQPEFGVLYTPDDFNKFPSIVEGTRWIEQPGHTRLFGEPVFVWCKKDRIMISPAQNSLDVCESTVVAAEVIEPHLTKLRDRIFDPPRDTDHYLCEANYPNLKSGQGATPNPNSPSS